MYVTSYAREQSLLEFLNASEHNNNTHLMQQDEMLSFLQGLQNFINAKVVDDEIAAFYKKYFLIETQYKNYNLCREVNISMGSGTQQLEYQYDSRPLCLNVRWMKSNMRTVCLNLHDHLKIIQLQDAPQNILIPQNCDKQIIDPFNVILRDITQQNPLDPITFLYIDPYSGQPLSKTISKSQLPVIEALQQPMKLTDTKYPASKNETLNTFKKLVAQANKVSDLQDIFDIACVCVNQHQNIRWDSFWGIQNTSSLREIITFIREKALNLLFRDAPAEQNIEERILHFDNAAKLSLFTKHKNNFKITGAFGDTHSLKAIEYKIDRLRTMHKTLSPEL